MPDCRALGLATYSLRGMRPGEASLRARRDSLLYDGRHPYRIPRCRGDCLLSTL